MPKYLRLVKVIFVILIILAGCDIVDSIIVKDRLSHEQIDKFVTENNIKALSMESKEDSTVIAYGDNNEYGIMILRQDDSTDGIGYAKGSLDANKELDEIEYIQLGDDYEAYIGIFILDESLKDKDVDIYVEFKDKEPYEPYAIQTSIEKKDALIISYKKQQELREIERIDVIDRKGKVVYSKPIQ